MGVVVTVRFMVGALLMLITTPLLAVPNTEAGVETAVIPFDPPLGESLRYRSERSLQKDGKTKLIWDINDYSFQETDDGYSLTVTPVSGGSNETDPEAIAFMKLLADLSRIPYVVRINGEAEIVGLDSGDEFWSKLTSALKSALGEKAKRPEQTKALQGVISLYENMPAENRLALLTEPVSPLISMSLTETAIGKPVVASIETESPFGGTLKRQVTISLTRVDGDFAYLTARTTTPGAEVEKLTMKLLNRMGVNFNGPEKAKERDAAIATLRAMKVETVSYYKIALADGMLETFQSTETVDAIVDGKQVGRVKTHALTRLR
jgi:hypothetical protein